MTYKLWPAEELRKTKRAKKSNNTAFSYSELNVIREIFILENRARPNLEEVLARTLADSLIRKLEEYARKEEQRQVLEVLRHHARRIDELERRVSERTRIQNFPRLRIPPGDPPCVVCGKWSDDWLCPECREKYGWMRS